MKLWKPTFVEFQIGERLKFWKPGSIGTWFVAAVPVVGGIIGIYLGMLKVLPNPTTPYASVVYVLDVSDGMPPEKLKWAISAIQNHSGDNGIATQLRLVSGGCDDANDARPTVGFHTNNSGRYQDAFDEPSAQRTSSYFTAVDSGAADLVTTKPNRDSTDKVLQIYMAKPVCGTPPGAIASGVRVVVFWLGKSRWQRPIKRQLAAFGFTSIQVNKIDSEGQLFRLVGKTMKKKPCQSNTPAGIQYCE